MMYIFSASGAALGVVGVASYIGAGVQGILSGRLIGDSKTAVDGITAYDFSSIRYFWIGAAALSSMLCAGLRKRTGGGDVKSMLL
jgi:OPA family sugar phosphate sensor protein UhpC-like MFS transporter